MKTRLLLLSAIVAISAFACTKTIEQPLDKDVETPSGNVHSFVVEAEANIIADVAHASAPSKTVLNGDLSVSWVAGDEISVFGETVNNEFTLDSIDGEGKAIFSGSASGSEFYALYPYDSESSITAGGIITTSLPCDQTGVSGTFAPGLNKSVAHTDGSTFVMKNVFGLIRFTLTRSDITSVTISSNGNEFMTGKVEITIDGSGIPSCSVVNGTRYVTVRPSGSTFAPGTYYAVVLPGTYAGGLRMTLATATQADVRKKTADAIVTRSHILNGGTPDATLALNNIIELGSTETANCYVAGEAGRRYKMPVTVMGNGYTLAPDGSAPTTNGKALGLAPSPLAPESSQLLWQTAPNLVRDVTYDSGYVYFTLNGSVGGALTQGNASIAVYSGKNTSGDLLWSWHIWVTDADLDGNVETWKEHSDYSAYSNYVAPVLMDRNLGALSNEPWSITGDNTSFGMLYQWGRKDPFPGADDSSATSTTKRKTYDVTNAEIAIVTTSAKSSAVQWGILPVQQHPDYNATTNPEVYTSPTETAKYPMRYTKLGNGMWLRPNQSDLWGWPPYAYTTNFIGHKTIYDPCPPGYRVMNPFAMGIAFPSGSRIGGEYATLGNGNILNVDTFTEDRGVSIQYDGSHSTWLPSCGFVSNNTDYVLSRTGAYGYYWSCQAGANHNGMDVMFDYLHFYSIGNGGSGHRSSMAMAVRCEKIK